jgi:hypothetical protein
MNKLKVGCGFRSGWRVAVLLVVLLAGNVRADEPQSARFLLVFETSPAFKKNLPTIRQTLGRLFGSNLQGEIKTDDDLAVWTVDKELHTATFALANWEPDEAGIYGDRLVKFLEGQKTSRQASLNALQPLLNRVVKDSQRLTVLIFCDTDSRLVGTPYDSGVNEIITNAAAKNKGPAASFIIVLRAYHGAYLGCSVNRAGGLNFPKFPVPKPEPVKPVVPPAPKPEPIVVKTGPSMIIVGTKEEPNVPAAKPAIAPASVPAAPPPPNGAVTTPVSPVITPAAAASTPAAVAPPVAPVAPPVSPKPAAPVPTPIAPVPVVPETAPIVPSGIPPVVATSTPATAVAPEPAKPAPPVAPVAAAPAAVPVASGTPTNPPVAVVPAPTANGGWLLPLALAAVALLAAAVIVLALVVRARRPHGSLITSSMQDHEDRD